MIKVFKYLNVSLMFFPVILLPPLFGRSFFIPVLFFAALLHEGGHFLAAHFLGAKPRRINLMPYGAQLELAGAPPPFEEGVIAAAGPLVSLALLPAAAVFNLPLFYRANLYILIINLLPAPPLDGGRILRAVLCRFLGCARGRRAARRIGRVVGVLTAAAGAVLSPWLLFIGLFMLLSRESLPPPVKMLLQNPPQKSAARLKKINVSPGAPALALIERFTPGRRRHIINITGQSPCKITEEQVLKGILSLGAGATMGEVAKLILESESNMG